MTVAYCTDLSVVALYWFLTPTARDGGSKLQALTGEHRSAIVNRLADLLLERKSDIIAANQQDVSAAYSQGIRYWQECVVLCC